MPGAPPKPDKPNPSLPTTPQSPTATPPAAPKARAPFPRPTPPTPLPSVSSPNSPSRCFFPLLCELCGPLCQLWLFSVLLEIQQNLHRPLRRIRLQKMPHGVVMHWQLLEYRLPVRFQPVQKILKYLLVEQFPRLHTPRLLNHPFPRQRHP